MKEKQGDILASWQPPPLPLNEVLKGQYCILQPLNVDAHANDLWAAYALDTDKAIWDYLPYGPFSEVAELQQCLHSRQQSLDEQYYAILDKNNNKAVGFIAYLRIQASHGSIEIGCLTFSPLLQKTRMATEAVYLLIYHCFNLGYRRCEWKCNSLNEASKKAAVRFGFQYEGCFRQAMVVKGKNRDTYWYSIIDTEWPKLKLGFESWLSPSNFDDQDRQLNPLSYFTK